MQLNGLILCSDQSAADDLDASDTATDSFTYTRIGWNARHATLIITVTGINDAPAAVNDTDAVNEDATVTSNFMERSDVITWQMIVMLMSDDSLTVTQIGVTGGSNSACKFRNKPIKRNINNGYFRYFK